MLIAGSFCFCMWLVQFGRYEGFERGLAQEAFATVAMPTAMAASTRLEIPRIGLSVAVLEGDSSDNLALGAAHLTDTAALGSHGNAAIAAHRDLAFRGLGDVKVGDRILVHSFKDFAYRVTGTRIVNASDTSALADDGRARLTLITCYPFRYVGSAPQRFLVEAELL